MTYWLPASGKVYLPPSTPVARVQSTDEFVQRTNIFYHANSDRLLTVGHPYFEVKSSADPYEVLVPKVSGNQFRAFRVKLPDPNRFALADMSIYNPDKERLVWGCRGLEIGRGQPLGVGTTGHPLFNKVLDTENPNKYNTGAKDDRVNTSFDPKQIQLFVVGCTPCLAEHWDTALPCAEKKPDTGGCPPLELKTTVIQDGDMVDIGFGNMNFKALSVSKSDVSLDIVDSTCKYPDFLKMSNDIYGNSCFFYGRREQCYVRHMFVRGGVVGDAVPNAAVNEDHNYMLPAANDQAGKQQLASSIYFPTVSGSLVSTDAQLFNRPYWLQRAQGHNNGICWSNELFITVCDNTRNTNFNISVPKDEGPLTEYDSQKIKEYVRHVEEYELSLILQLCKIPLEAEILAQINAMNPNILEDWQLGFVPTPDNPIQNAYRFIHSKATPCSDKAQPKEREDPWAPYTFWVVDMTEKLSLDLDQYSLGRKFLFQAGLTKSTVNGIKRTGKGSTRGIKRKRKSN